MRTKSARQSPCSMLCADKDQALARYALEGLPNQVLAAEYKLQLPDEETLARELEGLRAALLEKKRLQGGAENAGDTGE
ncbi:MAG: DUF1016 family protein [Thermaceae bacterium]|nr:DUF1016 family protein [Thermaceae bacterium]